MPTARFVYKGDFYEVDESHIGDLMSAIELPNGTLVRCDGNLSGAGAYAFWSRNL
jgi:hypothetical protein